MKYIIIILFFPLVLSSAYGQEELPLSSEIELTKSSPYPVVDARSKHYFSDNNGGVLSIKVNSGRGKQEFIFQKFEGDKLNESKRKTEVIENRAFSLQYFIELKDNLYMFYSEYDKPSKTYKLFARTINKENGGFSSKGELLITTNNKLTDYFNRFQIDVSSNEDVFVIKTRHAPKVKANSKNKDILSMYVFDAELNAIWDSEFTMPYTETMMDNLDFAITSNQKAYFLIKKYKAERTRANREDPNNESFALLVTDGEGDLEEVEFSLGNDNMIVDAFLKESTDNKIICAGYFRKPKSYAPDGAFVSIYTEEGGIEETQLYEFTLEFIKKYNRLSERKKKKLDEKEKTGEVSMTNLRMRKIRILNDGSIVLAGEIFYITSHTDSKGNTHTTYHYLDVILTKINADGELGWMRKLPKRSTVESFKLFTSANYTYVLFSDNPKNSLLTDDQRPHMSNKDERQVITYRIDNESGEKKYLALFGYKEIDGTKVYQYSLGRIVGLNENTFAVEMYIKQKSDMMFKIHYDEE
jgi:hypothetical protein